MHPRKDRRRRGDESDRQCEHARRRPGNHDCHRREDKGPLRPALARRSCSRPARQAGGAGSRHVGQSDAGYGHGGHDLYASYARHAHGQIEPARANRGGVDSIRSRQPGQHEPLRQALQPGEPRLFLGMDRIDQDAPDAGQPARHHVGKHLIADDGRLGRTGIRACGRPTIGPTATASSPWRCTADRAARQTLDARAHAVADQAQAKLVGTKLFDPRRHFRRQLHCDDSGSTCNPRPTTAHEVPIAGAARASARKHYGRGNGG